MLFLEKHVFREIFKIFRYFSVGTCLSEYKCLKKISKLFFMPVESAKLRHITQA